ncbi:MAG: hypothetical protein K2X87_35180 [Gemmataceae bacterium]|nr:hypothetical protein [Gemmataceae bacterium]
MRKRWVRIVGLIAALALAAGGGWWAARSPAVTLRPRAIRSTSGDFWHDGPPPWPHGNRFSLTADPDAAPSSEWWLVLNMHAENYTELSKRLGLETLRILPVGPNECLIIDRRVPRDWLLDAPLGPPDFRREMLEKYPQYFRPPAPPPAP